MPIRLCAAGAAALILAGCSLGTIRPAGEVVRVPVPVPCLRADQVPAWPELYAESTWAQSSDPFERLRALMLDRLQLLGHAQRLQAAIQACIKE